MKTLCCATYLLVGICVSVISGSTLPEAKLTVKLVDESGSSLAGLPVTIGFSDDSRHGVSDTNGCFSATGRERFGDPRCGCDATGYYSSDLPYLYSGGDTNSNCWLPWNPVVTLVVRQVVNPISMYARRVETLIPSTNTNIGFDLMCGDWVMPYGRGQLADVMFCMTRRVVSSDEYEGTLQVTFTNSGDGIQTIDNVITESKLQSPRLAPVDGYQMHYSYSHGKDPVNGYYGARVDDAKKQYFFRIRSTLDSQGRPKEAMYGKFVGGIEFAGAAAPGRPRILFAYYLNPTLNDRNLEFDPKRNLFKDLKSTEEVTSP